VRMRSYNDERVSEAGVMPALMLAWYAAWFVIMAWHPLDHKVWWTMNILPVLFVAVLIGTRRRMPLSNASYVMITVWLTLHTVAAHYTYPKVPLGFWLDQWFDFHRNHFDRIVNFSFGFFLTLPLAELFRRRCGAKGWLLPYLVVITILGFSAFWEMVEAWAGQIAHPDLERALVGHQGDIWDPQRDMAAAFYGSLLCVGLLALLRKLHEPDPDLEPEPMLESAEIDDAAFVTSPSGEQA
jgi:putative membrane protein